MTKLSKSQAALKRWGELTEEERLAFRNQQSNSAKRYWARLTPEQRRERSVKLIEARREMLKGKS